MIGNEQLFYTIDEAKLILKISRITVQRKLRTGEIPAVKLGRRVLIPGSFFTQLAESALQPIANSI